MLDRLRRVSAKLRQDWEETEAACTVEEAGVEVPETGRLAEEVGDYTRVLVYVVERERQDGKVRRTAL